MIKSWDGIQYFDPATKKCCYDLLDSPADTQTVRLRLECDATYWLYCEDGSISPMQKPARA